MHATSDSCVLCVCVHACVHVHTYVRVFCMCVEMFTCHMSALVYACIHKCVCDRATSTAPESLT